MKNEEIATKQDVEELKEELREMKEKCCSGSQQGRHPEKKWLTTREVTKYIGISNSTLYNLRSRGVLYAHQIGGTLIFSKEEIDNAITNNDVE